MRIKKYQRRGCYWRELKIGCFWFIMHCAFFFLNLKFIIFFISIKIKIFSIIIFMLFSFSLLVFLNSSLLRRSFGWLWPVVFFTFEIFYRSFQFSNFMSFHTFVHVDNPFLSFSPYSVQFVQQKLQFRFCHLSFSWFNKLFPEIINFLWHPKSTFWNELLITSAIM